MLIMTKEKSRLVSSENLIKIEKDYLNTPTGVKIRYAAEDILGDMIWLGTYDNTPEHENLIDKIAQCAGAINVFYMPEE